MDEIKAEFKLQLADFSSICRICLNRESLVTLSNTNYLDMLNKIIKTENNEIDMDELLPSNICTSCVARIEDLTSFITLWETSQMLFKQVLEDGNKSSIKDCKFDIIEFTENGVYSDSEPELLEENSDSTKKNRRTTAKRKSVPCTKRPPTVCTICSQSFSSTKKFVMHAKLNPECGVKNHKCDVCDKSFFTELKLKYHMICHSDEKPFKCEVCYKAFRYAQNLRRHDAIAHKGLKPFKCELCGKEFSRLLTKNEHMSKHTGNQAFSCQYCGLKFHYYAQYFSHSYLHKLHRGEVNNTSFKVQECEKSSKILSVECTICLKTIFPSTLFRHKHGRTKQVSKVPDQKNFLCNICGKSFLRKVQLQSHSLVHTDLKPFKCDKCLKSFRHVSTLKSHLLLHRGVKPFSCQLCECSFTQRQHLKQHILIHTGEKPYACKWCDKKFANKSNLTVHNRLHTGETPFKCAVCQRGYCDSTSMKKHMKSQHGSADVD